MAVRPLLQTRWIGWSVGAAGIVLALIIALAFALTGPMGRALVGQAVDGRAVDGLGTLQIEGLEGNILSDLSLARVEIHDEDGAWLTLQDVRVRWSAISLVTGPLEIEAIEVARLDLYRRPAAQAEAPPSSGGGVPAIRLDALSIAVIHLSEGVAGPEADYTLEGQLTGAVDGALTARLQAQRIDAAGDRITLEFERDQTGQISGQASIDAPAGGLLAETLSLGETGWSLTSALNGALEDGRGTFTALIGDQPVSQGLLSWTGGAWTLSSDFDPAAWPELPAPISALFRDTQLRADGQLQPFSADTLEAQSAGVILQAQQLLGGDRRATLTLTPGGVDQLRQLGIPLQAGQARLVQRAPEHFDLQLDMSGLAHPAVSAAQLLLQAELRVAQNALAVTATGFADGLSSDTPAMGSRLPDRADFNAELRYELSQDRLTVTAADLRTSAGQARAQGDWIGGQALPTGTVRVDIPAIEALNLGLEGPLSLTAVATAEPSAPSLVLTAQSEGLGADTAASAMLGRLDARAELQWVEGQVQAPVLRVETDAVSVLAQAAQDGDVWTLNGDGLFDLEALPFEALAGQAATAFDLTITDQGLSARVQTEAETLLIDQHQIDNPTLRTQISLTDGALEGVWRIDATAQDTALSAEGNMALQGDQVSLAILQSQWGHRVLTGSVAQSGDRLVAQLAARDLSQAQPWQSELRYEGPVAAPLEGQVSGFFNAGSWALPGGGTLAKADVHFDGPLSRLPIQLAAEGLTLQVFQLSADGRLEITETGARYISTVDGAFGGEALATRQPLIVEFGGDGLSASADLRAGEATLTAQLIGLEALSLTAAITDASAGLVAELAGLPPATGRWSVETQLTQVDEVWRGAVVAQLEDIRPQARPDGEALSGQARLDLAESAAFRAVFDAGAFSLNAHLDKPGPIRDLGVLSEPGWRGTVDMAGPLDTLAQLYLPATEQFTGRMAGSARFEPGVVSGQVQIEDGVYRSQTAGVRLEPFGLQARFSDDRLYVTEAELGDGQGGRATATGEIGLTDDGLVGQGDVAFDQFQALARPELSVVATGTSQLRLDGRDLAVTGEARINRLSLTPTTSSASAIPEIEVQEINRPDTLDPPYRRPIRIALDYRVHADNGLFVSSRTFNSEWATDVQVQGPLNQLMLTGQARLLSGQASLLTRIFDMNVGEITFRGPIERTRLLLEGQHSRSGLTVTARAEGPITQPSLSFVSDPSLPEDEVLSRLLFNQNTAALSPLQAAQLAAQLSGRNWLGALSQAGQRLGVDRLDISEGENGQIALIGGRQIAQNVYLELETSTAAALGAARIEWSITPDIVILSRLTGDTNGELAIRWRREFD